MLSINTSNIFYPAIVLLIIVCLGGLASIKYAPMDVPTVLFSRSLTAFALRCIVTLKSSNMLIASEFLRVIHTDALDGDAYKRTISLTDE